MKLNDRAKSIVTGLIVLLLITLVLMLAECTVRARQWLKYGNFNNFNTSYIIDQKTGLRVPAAGQITRTIAINSLGFRGPEIDVPKPTNRLRIAFLGASTTYCAEVSSNSMTWPHLVIEQWRKAYPDVSLDYVNGGVPGYTVQSSLENLRKRVAQLNPDVIVIYDAVNDLSGETRELASQQGIYQKDQKLEETSWLAEYSLLWFLLEKNLRLFEVQRQVTANQGRLQFEPARLGEGFRKDLTELIEAAKRTAKVVAIATFSEQIRAEQTPEQQLKAAGSSLYYMPFMTPQGLLASFTRYNEIIREVSQATGVILIGGEMDIPGDDKHFNDTVHFKDAGSRLMAKRVSDALLNAAPFQRLVETKAGNQPL